MTAIARSDFRDAVDTLLQAQQAATPGTLRDTMRLGPSQMAGEKPVAWQGEITDEFDYDSGIRFRTMTQQVQLATTFPADIPSDDFDDLMDALVERFTANADAVATAFRASTNVIAGGDSVLELMRIDPTEYAIARADGASNVYRSALLTIRLRIQEGRL